jgi:hypothetical protein
LISLIKLSISFLPQRKFRVSVEGEISTWRDTQEGAPRFWPAPHVVQYCHVFMSVTDNNGVWIGWLDLLTPSCTLARNHNKFTITHNKPSAELAQFWSDLSPFWSGLRLAHSVSQSQTYFMTGSLPSVSSSWQQAPWDSRPVIFLSEYLLS